MKRMVISMLLLCSILTLSACGGNNTPVSGKNSTEKEVAQAQEKVEDKKADTKADEKADKKVDKEKASSADKEKASDYKIKSQTYTDDSNGNSIKIVYPQLDQYGDNDQQKDINTVIKNCALKIIEDYDGMDGKLTIDANYKVSWKSSRLLSIQYTVYANVEGAAYPQQALKTDNIDLKNAIRLELKDFVQVDDAFVSIMKQGTYLPADPQADQKELKSAVESVLKETGNSELLDNLNSMHAVFYFTEKGMVVSIAVPHVMGDFADFEIKYSAIKKNVNASQEIWKDFIK